MFTSCYYDRSMFIVNIIAPAFMYKKIIVSCIILPNK